MVVGVLAGSFVDSSQSDWDLGAYTNMTTEGDNLTLAKNGTGDYNLSGGYVSGIFDANEVVSWEIFNWTEFLNSNFHVLTFSSRQSNNSIDWDSWSAISSNGFDLAGTSRYMQYMVNASTTNISSAPKIESVGIAYGTIDPYVSLDSPANGQQFNMSSDVDFDCSVGSPNNLSNITFYWNYSGQWTSNGTDNVSGQSNSSSFSKLNLSNGTYVWNCHVWGSAGHSAWASANSTLSVAAAIVAPTDIDAPVIIHTITPVNVVNGSDVTINVGVNDDVGVDSVWAIIDYPSTGSDQITLTNDADNAYTVTRIGRHDVTIFANDTSGNQSNVTSQFYSVALITFSAEVEDYNGSGIDSDLVVYEANSSTQAGSFSSSQGDFSDKNVANGTYDFEFIAFSNDFSVLLEGVNIWENTDQQMDMDMLPAPATGFELTYAAETNYGFNRALVRIYYDDDDIADEDGLELYVCDDWDFSARQCDGSWDAMSETLSTTSDYIEAYVSGFSAFSVMQGGYCGDGTCDDDEDSTSCSQDCACTNGETRYCSDQYQGRCAVGNETCVNGAWVGCPLAVIETCDRVDDDCDGTIDNVDGGDSVETTMCGCYDGASPVPEIGFDGIDNDCNGIIDEGCDCREGDTDTYGSRVGECVEGIRTCVNCEWTISREAVGPFAEVCGNGLDDDCDGQSDEVGCVVQTDVVCGYGPIPTAGCKCGTGTYAQGFCCNDLFSNEPCPEFPWWILVVVGVAIIAVIVALHFLKNMKKDELAWERLEKKYTPANGKTER